MAETVRIDVANGIITPEPDPLDLRGKGPNVQIHWKIATPGWKFTPDGIVISGNTGQFHQPEHHGALFKLKDKNSDGRTYKYAINVTDGNRTLVLDPSIVNE
jgi:hypothetical protein